MLYQSLFAAVVAFTMMGQTQAQEVIVEDPEGGTHTFSVSREERFNDVCRSIAEEMQEISPSKDFRLTLSPGGYCFTIALAKKTRKEARSYAAGISKEEGADISYIVKTLSNSTLPKIKSNESSLKKAGDRIDAVHPLQFLTYVFMNEELKVALRNLQGRSWVWKDFISGLTDTLAEENKKGNIVPFLSDFCSRLHVDINFLTPLQQGDRWEKFVKTLIDIIPREDGRDRYNQ